MDRERGRRAWFHRSQFALVLVLVLVAALVLFSVPSRVADRPPGARTVRNVAYGPAPVQQLDLYLPAGWGPYPVLVYLHSGGWVAGSHDEIPDFMLDEVAKGYALAAVDYTLASAAKDDVRGAFPAPNEDVDRAVRYMRAHAATWNLDPSMIVLAGASAGGNLALLGAVAPGRFAAASLPADLRAVSPDVEGVMSFVAPSDLTWLLHYGTPWVAGLTAAYLGCANDDPAMCSEQVAAAASPQTYVHAGIPPAYFVYGASDTAVPARSQGLSIARAWAAARGARTAGPPFGHGVYFEVAPAGHNLDRATVDDVAMNRWLASVRAESAPISRRFAARA